ncbi:MAG: NAD(P)H-dependent glycerol-3-phosphate dehydrogenase [Candidatus Sumerlaeaceae bacterium]|jgi:glycerol-3-phosphate dehydrogenase (NAD(P)+)
METVTVFGAGAWGATLADLLARKGAQVTVWDVDSRILEQLRTTRRRGKPPALVVHDSVVFEAELSTAAHRSDVWVCVVPSFAVRDLCRSLGATFGDLGERVFVNCAKGIEEQTLAIPSDIFAEELGRNRLVQYAVLSGPSHAEEVCLGIPTSVVCASDDDMTARRVQALFGTRVFRIYTQKDRIGVEMGAALKNVIAIAAGACDGLGFGDNTKAALVTRGLAEITRAAVAVGASPQTLAGLAGLGDLIVTAMSRHSRNRLFGELLAKGRSVTDALQEVGAVVEGYRTCSSAYALSQKLGIEMPITAAIYGVLYEGISIQDATAQLLDRDPKPEIY